jgi:hypothetical protein
VLPSSIFAFFEGFLSYQWHWRDVVSLASKWVGPLASVNEVSAGVGQRGVRK